MPSIRQNKISRLLQREMALVLQELTPMITPGAMVTVTTVRVTADFSIARYYLSIFSPNEDPKKILEKIEGGAHRIKSELASRIKNQLRKIPEVRFYLDDSLDYAERIDDLLS